jgi:hypothetical protein
MQNKQVKQSYKGMVKDLTKSKFPNSYYFDAKNIKITATNSQSTFSITNEKGNSFILDIPIVTINKFNKVIFYNDKVLNYVNKEIDSLVNNLTDVQSSETQLIVGHTTARNNIILFTTDNRGFDCVWKVNDSTFEIELLYIRNLGFSTLNPIQAISNYENEIIDKVYWVDGKNQMRFLNIHNSIENGDYENLIDLNVNIIQITGTYNVSQPTISNVVYGGTHTSGVIQYAYNLYKVNSSQTKLSPLSELVALDKGIGLGGGDVNEVLGSTPIVTINNIDTNYNNIKLYSIKYTSYNQLPQISLILDKPITGVNSITYYDDGNIIQDISLEEFSFLGSDIVIPKHINTKSNIMFLANYKERNFDINTTNDETSIDLRAYSFSSNTISTPVYNSLISTAGVISSEEPELLITSSTINTGLPVVDYKHSTINKNYDFYNKQFNSNIFGGEGAYLKYKIKRNRVGVDGFTIKNSTGKFLKDNEIYRLAIQFYNNYGQESLPKWIADFKVIVDDFKSNLNGYYASIEIEFKDLFYDWLNNNNNFLDKNGNFDEFLKPVGYKLLRAERNIGDRTILCQGLLNGMLSQVTGDNTGNSGPINGPIPTDVKTRVNKGLKIPSMMRRFDDYLAPMFRNSSYYRVDLFNPGTHPETFNPGDNEVFKSPSSGGWTSGTYQFNQLMQMFSPEITFNFLQNINNVNLNVVGGVLNSDNQMFAEIRNIENKLTLETLKVENAISEYDIKAVSTPSISSGIYGVSGNFHRHGWFGPIHGPNKMAFTQTYREYLGVFKNSSNLNPYTIYGNPEIVETGQGRTLYNNDNELAYSNSLEPLSTDTGNGSESLDPPQHGISSINSWGAKNVTFALGTVNTDTVNRISLEKLFILSNANFSKGMGLIGEFRINKDLIYVGNIYGGNSYESKKRSNYVEIGDYNLITNPIYNCIHTGDTFVSNFKFTKLVKTETEIYNINSRQLTEIVNVRVETTIDLKNRNDLSLTDWNNRFQPKYNEYQKYNRVYSQDSNLLLRRDVDYKFKKVNGFDTNIIATKVKVPGEIIDSWTDLQPNNVMTLDGKYGPINILHKFKDELYTLQDNALAYLSIQPRVQVQGSDGISVELGTGTVLNEYKYLSTESGTLNKWSVVNSPSMFYYYDTLNNSINVFKGQPQGLSDSKGLHIWFTNNISLEELKINNPLLKLGVSSGYDYINNDMFMTFHQTNKEPFTISFNEAIDQFISYHDYFPSMYISRGDNFITTHPDINKIYQQNNGEYNNFYGETFKSTVTLMINPEADMDTVFDNIMFKSEVYINDIDQPEQTLTALRLYNEYQDSGIIPLELGRNKNLRRKFRDWNAILPRNNGTRERIRNPWIYLTLEFDNTTNKKLILHDIVVSYSV